MEIFVDQHVDGCVGAHHDVGSEIQFPRRASFRKVGHLNKQLPGGQCLATYLDVLKADCERISLRSCKAGQGAVEAGSALGTDFLGERNLHFTTGPFTEPFGGELAAR